MTGTSKGPTYVPLEVTTRYDDESEAEMGYQHLPFSQRVARRQRRQGRPRSLKAKLIGGVAAACIVAAFVLWGWALVLLLQRLNAMRLPKPQEPLVSQKEEPPPLPYYLPALPPPEPTASETREHVAEHGG
ncbi:hypothetical protein AK812_SmicGene40711 [Symbiodinium microadriaticum]|uniref:Uncharacterized protein n=1 Tax=Symbiodinium microadriaticum TaxID=2951 RepID=A0A1Q9C814_SYMMI|nr:hypothetical protein AK812_SmicGene40711 [Symbiodinium microadriaticum]